MSQLNVTTLKHESAGVDNLVLDSSGNATFGGVAKVGGLMNPSGSASAIAMDSAGRVTMPYQPHYVATARASSFNTNGETNYTTFVHRDTKINTGNHMNTSTGKFTCPVAGRYLVSFQGLCRGAGSFNIAIVLNGAQYNQLGRAIVASGTEQNVKTFAIVSCAANDELRIDCSTSVSGDIYFEHNSTSIVLIG